MNGGGVDVGAIRQRHAEDANALAPYMASATHSWLADLHRDRGALLGLVDRLAAMLDNILVAPEAYHDDAKALLAGVSGGRPEGTG